MNNRNQVQDQYNVFITERRYLMALIQSYSAFLEELRTDQQQSATQRALVIVLERFILPQLETDLRVIRKCYV